jgi:hypothetical protein
MSASTPRSEPGQLIRESLRIAGAKVSRDRVIEVRHPYSGQLVGTVPKATLDDVKRALQTARAFRSTLTRHDRYGILMTARASIASTWSSSWVGSWWNRTRRLAPDSAATRRA